MDDWCNECGTPIGLGRCAGCNAAASVMDDSPRPESHCPHCGKEYEEFSDLGCEHCDARHPGFGVTH